jgi:hypothetical protein
MFSLRRDASASSRKVDAGKAQWVSLHDLPDGALLCSRFPVDEGWKVKSGVKKRKIRHAVADSRARPGVRSVRRATDDLKGQWIECVRCGHGEGERGHSGCAR